MPSGFTARDTAIFYQRKKKEAFKNENKYFSAMAKFDNKYWKYLEMLFNIKKHNNRNATIVALTTHIRKSIEDQRAKLADLLVEHDTITSVDYIIKEYTKASENMDLILSNWHFKRNLYKETLNLKYFKSPSKLDCLFNPALCEKRTILLPTSKLTYYSPSSDPNFNKDIPKDLIYSFTDLAFDAVIEPLKINPRPQQKKSSKLRFWYSWDEYKSDVEQYLKMGTKPVLVDEEDLLRWEKYHKEEDLYKAISEVTSNLNMKFMSKQNLWEKRKQWYIRSHLKKHFWLY